MDAEMKSPADLMRGLMAPPIAGAIGTKLVQDFWDHQARLLGGMESFAAGWFERRRVGVEAAQACGQALCGGGEPTDCANALQTWWQGAADRCLADVTAWQELATMTLPAPATTAAEPVAGRPKPSRPKAA